MTADLGMREARDALETARQGRAALVEAMLVPNWYWWFLAVVVVGIGAGADTRRPGVIVGVTVPAALLIAAATGWVIVGRGRAQLSKELLGSKGVVALMGFIWAVVGVGLAAAFSLRASGVAHPGLLGTALTGLALAAGGPVLRRYLRRNMLGRPSRP